MGKYMLACHQNTKKAMTLYRLNLRISQEMFTIISCFEVALRNAIDHQLTRRLGQDWLRDSVKKGGLLDRADTKETFHNINKEYIRLKNEDAYSHPKLLSAMSFGTWKHMYAKQQFNATGKCLMAIFPNKPKSSKEEHINQSYIYNDLGSINVLRNRIAHHEPICFDKTKSRIDTCYAREKYRQIIKLYNWMGIDSGALLYGLDHVERICDRIDRLQ